MTENELRNGITAIEVVKSLDFKQAHIIIKDANNNEIDRYWYRKDTNNEIDRYWYRNDCFHAERISDNYKVLTVSITSEVSIIKSTKDPQVVLTVNK